MENEKKKGLCGICPDKCWIEATIENGKLVKVEPDKDSPFGRVCPRGALSKEIIYSKDRILHPMVRIGKKGEGKFRRATWEEALVVVLRALQLPMLLLRLRHWEFHKE